MPLYDYRCDFCATRFEKHHSMTDEPAVSCPACGSESRRQVSAVALRGAAHRGPLRRDLPTNLADLGGGRETLRHWRGLEARVARTESQHPELAPARRQVISHEGERPIYADSPVARSATAKHAISP